MDVKLLMMNRGEIKMRSPNEILLPTDLSPRSADVARYAAPVARHFNSKVTLLHVLSPINPALAAMGNAVVLDDVTNRQTEQALNRLNLFLTDELRDLGAKQLVVEGDQANVIAEYVAAENVGFIMMATRGCTAFRRFLLGSVTAKVLHDVTCPVWTSSQVTNGHPAVSAIPKVIVCAMEASAAGETILQWASELTADLGARLIITHAIPSLQFDPETYFLEADMRRALVGEAHSKISHLLQGSPTPGAEIRVEGGNVATVVRSVVEDNRADLLIIGRASGTGMLGRLRTHSYALIRESLCPVISV